MLALYSINHLPIESLVNSSNFVDNYSIAYLVRSPLWKRFISWFIESDSNLTN